ncbi:protein eva-1 isoform X4 [Folsomia candida]|uniref:protein eva-1 isoform X4 n=1 Tax=Folsomia candida TaxID=158441 RepID=UPI0016050E33|nr:protein eva-1 isoform X4 [Folsomia candida]
MDLFPILEVKVTLVVKKLIKTFNIMIPFLSRHFILEIFVIILFLSAIKSVVTAQFHFLQLLPSSFLLLRSLPIATSYQVYRTDPFALLSGTLRTYQKAGCDGEYVILRCPTGTTISVQLAQYGKTAPSPTLCHSPGSIHPELVDSSITDPYNNITCLMPSAIQTVVGLCQKKTSCKFQTSPRTFGGDPCPGARKYMETVYKCRPTEFKSVIGCETEVVQLRCNRSSRLAIYSANYGRTEYESVQCPQSKGVPEESCLSSFATETVMQMCHGKRRCALSVDPATFGTPCKPESSMYLKVIFTCVPRKVLLEKYQGEPEPDEMFDEETEDETGEPVGRVVELQLADHSKGWVNPKSTSKPNTLSKSHSSGESIMEIQTSNFGLKSSAVQVQREERGEDHRATSSNANSNNSQDVHIIYLISQGIQAYEFISRNTDKLWLYITISIASCLGVILSVLLVKIWIQRASSRRSSSGCTNNITNSSSKHPSSSSAGPITATGRLSDIDELSVVMDEITELPSILRKSSGPSDDLGTRGLAVSTVTSTNSSMLNSGGIVGGGPNSIMMSSTSSSTSQNQIPATMTLGRGLNRQREATNIRFYYD